MKSLNIKMKSLVSFIFIFSFIRLSGQEISGKIIDNLNDKPLMYVSIGVIDNPIGTITDEKGNFSFRFNNLPNSSTVRISMIGFKSKMYTIGELINKKNIIRLNHKTFQIDEVVIKPSYKLKNIGANSFSRLGGCCGWGGTEFGKGHEIGMKLELGDMPVKLRNLHIHLFKQSFDTTLFRLHIRNIVNNIPSNELLKNNILIHVSKKSGWVDIDLNKYNLVYKGNIALSLEWIKVDGINKNRLMKMNGSKQNTANVLFSVKKNQGCMYTRWGSEAKWSFIKDMSPSFYLTVQ